MAKLGKEQLKVARSIVARGTSVRQMARQLGVSEGALRYLFKKLDECDRRDGRSRQPSAVAGYQHAIRAILARLEDGR